MLKQALLMGAVAALPLAVATPTLAQSSQPSGQCTPLEVVGTNQTSITKTVSSAAGSILPLSRTNWDTDWAVPGGANYSRFRANVVSEAGGKPLDVDMYFKYSDQTADRVYHGEGVTLTAGQPLVLSAATQAGEAPYQVNLRIGGTDAEGITYTATVYGCR